MTNTSNLPGIASRLRRNDRRNAIIHGAAKAFVATGYEATSLEDIARHSSVSRALLYRHFDTKKDIYLAVIHSVSGLLTEKKKLEIDKDSLDARIARFIAVAQSEPDAFRLVFRHASREPEFRADIQSIGMFRDQYIDQKLSEAIPVAVNRQLAVALLRDTTIGILLTWIDNGLPEPERILPLLKQVITDIIESMR